MYLVHVPTGLAVFLGNRHERVWHTDGADILIGRLYEVLYGLNMPKDDQDDFSIAMTNELWASRAIVSGWTYGETRNDGLIQLIMPE